MIGRRRPSRPPIHWAIAIALLVFSTAAAQAAVYRGNVKSRVFHHGGCQYYDCKNCTRVFKDKTEAVAAGFRPCQKCNP